MITHVNVIRGTEMEMKKNGNEKKKIEKKGGMV
jgi:hypothetical protein